MNKSGDKTDRPKDKAEVPIDQVFQNIETRVEGLAGRMRDLVSENARLKAAVIEAAVERDRSKLEIESLRKAAEGGGEAAERLAKLESEREEIRARIERLLTSLEEAEAIPAES